MPGELELALTFAKLVVNDLDTAKVFYEAVFPLPAGAEFSAEIAGRPIREIIYQRPGERSDLILLTFEDAEATSSGGVILGVATNDAAAAAAKAVRFGGSVVEPAHLVEALGHSMTVAFVADPEGNMIEIVQYN